MSIYYIPAYGNLGLAMPSDRYYREGVERVNAPRHTRDLKRFARMVFDATGGGKVMGIQLPPAQQVTDTTEASRAYWEWMHDNSGEYERFAVNVSGGALTIALEHRHADEPDSFMTGEPSINHPRSVMVIHAGKATVWAAGVRDMGHVNALQHGTDVLPAFRDRLDHTLATISLGAALPDLRKAS